MKTSCNALMRLVVLVVALVMGGVGTPSYAADADAASQSRPKYIFLFIGDGMGPVQWQTSAKAAVEMTGQPMRMAQFPVRGQIHTRSADAEVTDSAAAATALAAGVKTNNGMIGQLPDRTHVVPLNDRLADELGMKVGILSSVQLNHATPAAFLAHVRSRSMYNQIARTLHEAKADLIIGNGVLSESNQRDMLISTWQEKGLGVINSLSEASDAQRLVAVLSFPNASREKLDPQAGPGELARAVAFAIERLDNPNGFFIMCEGGKIDSGGHGNNASMVIDETHAFDRAIEVAYQFYLKHPQQTLIVVTADHETGGMGLDESKWDLKRLMELGGLFSKVSSALGDDVAAITEEKARQVMADVLGITELDEQEQQALATAVGSAERNRKAQVQRIAMNIAQARAGVTFSTTGHSGVDVPVLAIGAGSELFSGTFDNTEIPAKILKLALPSTANAPQTELVPAGQ